MLKLMVAVRRHPALTQSEFAEHYGNRHPAVFLGLLTIMGHLARYDQTLSLGAEAHGATAYRPAIDRDAVSALWFESLHDMGLAFAEPDYSIVHADEQKFLDLADPSILFLPTIESRLIRPSDSARYVAIDFLARAPGIASADFDAGWMLRLAEAAKDAKAWLVAGLVANRVLPWGPDPRWPQPHHDLVLETLFETREALDNWSRDRRTHGPSQLIDQDTSCSFVGMVAHVHNRGGV